MSDIRKYQIAFNTYDASTKECRSFFETERAFTAEDAITQLKARWRNDTLMIESVTPIGEAEA